MRVVERLIKESPAVLKSAFTSSTPLPVLDVEVRLDWRCNAKCKYCGVWKYDRSNMMSVDRWKTAFTELREGGLSSVLFTGGEPMLYPHFHDLLEHVDRLGVETAFITNGSCLNIGRVNKLKRLAHLQQITVSLDSAIADVHDEVRQLKGLYALALKGMANVRSILGEVELRINTVLTPTTIEQVHRLLEFDVLPDIISVFPASMDGAWLDSLVSITENGWSVWAVEAKKQSISNVQWNSAVRELSALEAKAGRLGVALDYARLRFTEPFRGTCFVPLGHLVIQPDGTVFPCCHVQDRGTECGSLAETSFQDLVTGDKYVSLLRRLQPVSLRTCSACSRYRAFNVLAQRLVTSGE